MQINSELALLANMSEGAVRMAISDKTEGRLKAIPGSKPVAVEFAEAKRWLSGRRGFVPLPERAADDRFLIRAIRDAETPTELGRLVDQIAGIGAANRLAASLGWSAADVQSWYEGSFTFDIERAGQLAKALELDVPIFVGKALEVTLRSRKGGR